MASFRCNTYSDVAQAMAWTANNVDVSSISINSSLCFPNAGVYYMVNHMREYEASHSAMSISIASYLTIMLQIPSHLLGSALHIEPRIITFNLSNQTT